MRFVYKILILSVLLFSSVTFSQSKFNLGGSFLLGVPTGDLSDFAKTAIGGSINSEYRFNKRFAATLGVFYHSYKSKVPEIAVGGSTYDFSVEAVPVLAGLRYYFEPSVFGIVEAGVHFMRVSAQVYLGEDLSTEYKAKFGLGFGAGYRVQIAEPSLFELSAVYQYVSNNLSSISFRAAILIHMDKI